MINLKDIFSNYIDFIYSVGYFGEYIAFIVTIILIFNFKSYLIIYIIMFVLNKTINEYFKNYFKQARPENPRKFLESDKFSKKKYGMPSGHSQLVFFSIMYSYLVTGSLIPWVLGLLIIGLIVIYERYVFKNHTINQLISGAVLGSFIAYLVIHIVNIVMKK